MHELLAQYKQTATDISNKISEIKSNLRHYKGEEYFNAQKRIAQLEEMYTEVCWTIRDIANYLKWGETHGETICKSFLQ